MARSSVQFLFLSGLLALLAGCSHPRPATVPEVSPPLIQEEMYSWAGQVAGNLLFPCAAGLGWVDPKGRIITWDPAKNAAGKVFRLPFAVAGDPFRQGDFLTLKNQAGDRWLIFDLARMEIGRIADGTGAQRVLGIDGRHWVYLDGENLVVSQWSDPASVFRQPVVDRDFFNCHFLPERILIMSRGQLFIFWRQNGQFQRLALPLPASGEFACSGQHIYYGTMQRQLVKYSLREKKLAWKLKLGNDLVGRPLIRAGAIVLGTADNALLQVSGLGSVRWWRSFDSILEHALVPMSDHLAAFLLNRDVVFIDDLRRQATVFKIQGRPAGTPLAIRRHLYFMVQGSGSVKKLQRLGNRYGIDLALLPGPALWLGIPVTVSFQTHNLLSPRSQCLIQDESGQAVLMKKFKTAGRGSLVWLPKRTGAYRLRVSAAALNRDEASEVSLQVFDPRAIMPLLRLFLF